MEMKPVKIQAEVQWAFFDRVNEMSVKFRYSFNHAFLQDI